MAEFRIDQQAETPAGVVLGRIQSTGDALPSLNGVATWPFEQMLGHALIFGGPEAGNTETTLRIAGEVAQKTDAPVIYLHGLSAPKDHERFKTVMSAAGREVRSSLPGPRQTDPGEPPDHWRGDAAGVVERLLTLFDEPDRLAAGNLLRIACDGPDGPPRSSAELKRRLEDPELVQALSAFEGELLERVTMRFRAFFGPDEEHRGDWGWEDADAAFVELASSLTDFDSELQRAFLFADLRDFIARRKDPKRFCLICIDGVYPEDVPPELLRDATSRNTAIVICCLSGASYGEAHKLGMQTDLVLTHQQKMPDEIVSLGGTRMGTEVTHLLKDGEVVSSEVRPREEPRIDPNELRGMETGIAWAIRGGSAVKLAIEPALRT
ncbi:MAG TPA: hypothetical protein VIP57_11530 [Candidatus Dormibacteraeota bacterium]